MSIGLRSKGTLVLLDCGEGTQRQLLFSPLSPMKIDAVFITHRHGDHFLGLLGLVQSMSLNDRNRVLHVFGPQGMIKAWEHAVKMCPFTQRFPVMIRELSGGETFDFKEIRISCTEADHGMTSLCYRIDEEKRTGRFNRKKALEMGLPEGPLWGRVQKGEMVEFGKDGRTIKVGPEDLLGPERRGVSVVYTGDTRPCKGITEISRGADALVHEATFLPEMQELADKVGHSTLVGAASTASSAGVKRLILVHSSPRYTSDEEFEVYRSRAEELFPGAMIPEDLDEVEITR